MTTRRHGLTIRRLDAIRQVREAARISLLVSREALKLADEVIDVVASLVAEAAMVADKEPVRRTKPHGTAPR